MPAKEIGITLEERCRLVILFRAKEAGAANERGNDSGQGGW
jgi:hypothetical protein